MLLKILWVCPAVSSGQRCSCCPVRHRDDPRNVDSPENLPALAGVFGSRSGHPSLCLSGALLFKGLAPLVPLNTPCTRLRRSPKCLECVRYSFLSFCLFLCLSEDVLHHVLSGLLVWSTFAQMLAPFILVLRQQQQQVVQVSTVMSKTTTAGGGKTKTASWPAHSLKKDTEMSHNRERRLTHER